MPRPKEWRHERLINEAIKELVLTVAWIRPLHVVVVVDDLHEEERIATVYEPSADRWDEEYRRTR